MKYHISEILAAGQGQWPDAPGDLYIDGYSIDSRTLKPGDLFFAFKGDVQDGHKFVDHALEKGASAAFVRRDFRRTDGSSDKLVFCDDALESLHAVASWSREEKGLRVIGITGSCGKTTTKDIMAELLSGKLKVGKNAGNLNNIWGLPVAILRRPENCDVYVCELGMSFPDELRRVAVIARPDCAVITNIHGVHLMNFNSVQDVAEAKAEIFDGLKPGGTTVANIEDKEVMRISRRSGHPLLTFGMIPDADVSVSGYETLGIDGTALKLETPEGAFSIRFPLPGVHNVYNMLAAIGAGIVISVPVETMLERLEGISLSPLRSHIVEFEEGWTLFNDAYNSNPAAMTHVLDTIADSSRFSRKLLVLGDMLELGPSEVEEHWLAGQKIAAIGADRLITVGPLAVNMARSAISAGMPAGAVSTAETNDEALELILRDVRRGDLLLVKGSRGIKMEGITAALMEQFTTKKDGRKR
jgi:UDP-N-acetylmuramoyl-tripeptide--D-alanyl-D-alanine ligase